MKLNLIERRSTLKEKTGKVFSQKSSMGSLTINTNRSTTDTKDEFYNRVCLPAKISAKETMFHDFLDMQAMNELNVTEFLRDKESKELPSASGLHASSIMGTPKLALWDRHSAASKSLKSFSMPMILLTLSTEP